ncbi:restriction endonuclease subunit S [Arthrobacter sp. ok362]|uniref:restriction endonuclease subunit S n=1 Tax=Arthrobacter sp. ok362 TaxID=1761745 RepID=UPI000887BAA2|nr:restriction endonuclease subunit S [Arthrobacter sp. ok362]SDL40900.1 type I restriction enzyme, S subunit [Arthrobacter sp. ok362]
MNLNLDKSTWKRVRLGDVIHRSRKQVDPLAEGVQRYVAGGHIDSDSITIGRWGDPTDGQMGSTFRYVFGPGQVLFVSARPYLRKSGVVDFAGVVADKTYVLDAIPENGLLQEFLPFLVSSDPFIEYANNQATGSMNPRLLWGPLQRFELDLPPLDEQKRIADLLWAIERHRSEVVSSRQRANSLLEKVRSAMFDGDEDGVMANEVFEITIGRQRSPKHEVGDHIVSYLRSANVTLGGIDVSDVKSMNFTPREQAKFSLRPGDVLVSEASASAPSVGMPAAWNGELSGVVCFQNTLLRYRAIEGVTLPAFVEQYCNWAFETGQFLAAASGTNIRHIGVGGATSMRLRCPPLDEQRAFIADTSAAEASVRAIESEFLALKSLSTAIMAEIFGGN